MSRFELGGKGDPIPLIALPDPNLNDDLPAQVFVLSDGVPFDKTDWVGLGYTHFEVWCIGGAGGLGAPVSTNGLMWRANRVRVPLNATEWATVLRIEDYWARQLIPPYGPYIPGQDQAALFAYVEANNPGHLSGYVSTFFDAFLIDSGVKGGGGGGGGMEVASGLLADLGDLTDVVVGQKGADAVVGQTMVHGIWTPPAYENPVPTWTADLQMRADIMWSTEFHNEYPLPHKTFANPLPGGDGGASTFGGDICQASGGKGGNPYDSWNGSAFVRDGDGGEGGVGGRTLAGGGAAGAASDNVNGSDGSWDGTIGEGGGGGHAYKAGVPAGDFGFPPAIPEIQATDGGRGSFSYADTSVFGDREQRGTAQFRNKQVDYYTGAITTDVLVTGTKLSEPGGGGGARALRTMNKGSKAVSFDPNGIVVIRLTAVLP